MKIAFDHQIFLAQKYGGVSRYFVNLANNLLSENNVKIIAPLHRNVYLKNSSFKSNIYFKNSLPKTERFLNSFNRVISKSRLNEFKPDIIHQTYYSASHFNFDFNPIIVSTVHDMIHEKFPIYFPGNNRTIINKKNQYNPQIT